MIALNRRRVMGEDVPYDARIEYLESTGAQYIGTGIRVSDIIKVETTMQIAVTNSAQAEGNTRSLMYFFLGQNNQKKFYTGTGNVVSNFDITNDGLFHQFSLSYGEFLIDEIRENISGSPTSNNLTYYMFGCNGVASIEGNVGYLMSQKKRYMKIYGANGLLFDAIPVRVGNVGYMYDRVSKQLFGNSGTGYFILGGDV